MWFPAPQCIKSIIIRIVNVNVVHKQWMFPKDCCAMNHFPQRTSCNLQSALNSCVLWRSSTFLWCIKIYPHLICWKCEVLSWVNGSLKGPYVTYFKSNDKWAKLLEQPIHLHGVEFLRLHSKINSRKETKGEIYKVEEN